MNRRVVLFDGQCNLCNGAVKFIIPRDGKATFQFASLQSDAAKHLIRDANAPSANSLPDSILLIDEAGLSMRSTAAIRIARRLRFPWNLFWAFIIIPRPIRDAIYNWIARNRHRWFGKRDACMVPQPGWSSRFL
ncbi:MAG: DUF393 domain-containing protein [Planctomycetes bacterium]|nr:DUF393 domain-containing protein [Planctomycetota bacterium]